MKTPIALALIEQERDTLATQINRALQAQAEAPFLMSWTSRWEEAFEEAVAAAKARLAALDAEIAALKGIADDRPSAYTSCGFETCTDVATGYAPVVYGNWHFENRSACDKHGSDGSLNRIEVDGHTIDLNLGVYIEVGGEN